MSTRTMLRRIGDETGEAPSATSNGRVRRCAPPTRVDHRSISSITAQGRVPRRQHVRPALRTARGAVPPGTIASRSNAPKPEPSVQQLRAPGVWQLERGLRSEIQRRPRPSGDESEAVERTSAHAAECSVVPMSVR